MSNQKYDNLAVILAQGSLNWVSDPIYGLLWKGATFDSSHKSVNDVAAVSTALQVASTQIVGRSLGDDGSFLGWPASFHRIGKAQDFQVLLVQDVGTPDPMLLAFYDMDEAGNTLRLANNGTLIVRPVAVQGADPPVLGVWLKA